MDDITAAFDAVPDIAKDMAQEAAIAVLGDADVARAAMIERGIKDQIAGAKPHVVAGLAPIAVTVEQVITFDPSRAAEKQPPAGTESGMPYWLIPSTTRRQPLVDCPDCTRGTYSVGGVLVCVQLPARVGVLTAVPGDVVGCGRER